MSQGPETRLAELLRTVVDTVAAASAPELRRAAPQTFFSELRHAPDRDAFEGLDESALFVYRKLARTTLTNAISEELPRTRRAMGPLFERELEVFFASGLSASPYLFDVAFEFARFGASRWPASSELPSFLSDLARHELSAFRVAAARESEPDTNADDGELTLESKLKFSSAMAIESYAYAVHQIADGDAEVAPEDTHLLVYRDRENELHYLALPALSCSVLRKLRAGAPMGDAVVAACTEAEITLSEQALAQVASLLADLAQRGVVRGVR